MSKIFDAYMENLGKETGYSYTFLCCKLHDMVCDIDWWDPRLEKMEKKFEQMARSRAWRKELDIYAD